MSSCTYARTSGEREGFRCADLCGWAIQLLKAKETKPDERAERNRDRLMTVSHQRIPLSGLALSALPDICPSAWSRKKIRKKMSMKEENHTKVMPETTWTTPEPEVGHYWVRLQRRILTIRRHFCQNFTSSRKAKVWKPCDGALFVNCSTLLDCLLVRASFVCPHIVVLSCQEQVTGGM